MSCSAIPISKNLSGYSFANIPVFVAPAKSASNTTIFSFSFPNSSRFSPFFDIYLHFISIFFKFLYNIKVANFGFLVRLATFFLIIIYII